MFPSRPRFPRLPSPQGSRCFRVIQGFQVTQGFQVAQDYQIPKTPEVAKSAKAAGAARLPRTPGLPRFPRLAHAPTRKAGTPPWYVNSPKGKKTPAHSQGLFGSLGYDWVPDRQGSGVAEVASARCGLRLCPFGTSALVPGPPDGGLGTLASAEIDGLGGVRLAPFGRHHGDACHEALDRLIVGARGACQPD